MDMFEQLSFPFIWESQGEEHFDQDKNSFSEFSSTSESFADSLRQSYQPFYEKQYNVDKNIYNPPTNVTVPANFKGLPWNQTSTEETNELLVLGNLAPDKFLYSNLVDQPPTTKTSRPLSFHTGILDFFSAMLAVRKLNLIITGVKEPFPVINSDTFKESPICSHMPPTKIPVYSGATVLEGAHLMIPSNGMVVFQGKDASRDDDVLFGLSTPYVLLDGTDALGTQNSYSRVNPADLAMIRASTDSSELLFNQNLSNHIDIHMVSEGVDQHTKLKALHGLIDFPGAASSDGRVTTTAYLFPRSVNEVGWNIKKDNDTADVPIDPKSTDRRDLPFHIARAESVKSHFVARTAWNAAPWIDKLGPRMTFLTTKDCGNGPHANDPLVIPGYGPFTMGTSGTFGTVGSTPAGSTLAQLMQCFCNNGLTGSPLPYEAADTTKPPVSHGTMSMIVELPNEHEVRTHALVPKTDPNVTIMVDPSDSTRCTEQNCPAVAKAHIHRKVTFGVLDQQKRQLFTPGTSRNHRGEYVESIAKQTDVLLYHIEGAKHPACNLYTTSAHTNLETVNGADLFSNPEGNWIYWPNLPALPDAPEGRPLDFGGHLPTLPTIQTITPCELSTRVMKANSVIGKYSLSDIMPLILTSVTVVGTAGIFMLIASHMNGSSVDTRAQLETAMKKVSRLERRLSKTKKNSSKMNRISRTIRKPSKKNSKKK